MVSSSGHVFLIKLSFVTGITLNCKSITLILGYPFAVLTYMGLCELQKKSGLYVCSVLSVQNTDSSLLNNLFTNILKSRSDIKILCTIWITQSKFHSEDPLMFCATIKNQAVLAPLLSELLHGRIWCMFSEVYIIPNIIRVRISHEMNLENAKSNFKYVSTYLIYC